WATGRSPGSSCSWRKPYRRSPPRFDPSVVAGRRPSQHLRLETQPLGLDGNGGRLAPERRRPRVGGEGPVTDIQRCLTIHIALGTSQPCECEPHIGGGRFCHKKNNTDSSK